MSNTNAKQLSNIGSGTGRLAGKSAIITGGAAGMGGATSLAFANEGASMTIFDIQRDAGEEVAELINSKAGKAHFIEVDVSDADRVVAAGQEWDDSAIESVKCLFWTVLTNGLTGRELA